MPTTGKLYLAIVLAAGLSLAAADAGAGTIRGTVTDAATKVGLAGICVSATPDGENFTGVTTDVDGTYEISGLAIGEYEVFASDCTDPVEYSPVDYKNIRGLNRNKATFVKLKKDDKVKKNVNFKMPRAGHIVVRLRTSDDLPISGVVVCPFWSERDKKKKGNIFQSGFCTATEAGTGDAVLDVTAGGNKVFAFTSGGVYYGGPEDRTEDFDDAQVVTVQPGGVVEIIFKPNPTGDPI